MLLLPFYRHHGCSMEPHFLPQSPLHWYDGMLLQPEHFRYGFARSDALIHYRALHS